MNKYTIWIHYITTKKKNNNKTKFWLYYTYHVITTYKLKGMDRKRHMDSFQVNYIATTIQSTTKPWDILSPDLNLTPLAAFSRFCRAQRSAKKRKKAARGVRFKSGLGTFCATLHSASSPQIQCKISSLKTDKLPLLMTMICRNWQTLPHFLQMSKIYLLIHRMTPYDVISHYPNQRWIIVIILLGTNFIWSWIDNWTFT